jgi:hypothetical protein
MRTAAGSQRNANIVPSAGSTPQCGQVFEKLGPSRARHGTGSETSLPKANK